MTKSPAKRKTGASKSRQEAQGRTITELRTRVRALEALVFGILRQQDPDPSASEARK